MAKAKKAVPEGFHTVTPQLTLDNAAQAIDWYKRALGAEEVSRAPGPDGKIMHAELRIGDSKIMLNDAMMGGKGPKAMGGSPASLWIYVENCDAMFNRAVQAGAHRLRDICRGGVDRARAARVRTRRRVHDEARQRAARGMRVAQGPSFDAL